MRKMNQQAATHARSSNGSTLSFGAHLKAIRSREGLTQSELAKKLGISIQHLSHVETCRKHVSVERAAAWATVLGHHEATFVQLALQDQFRRVGLQGFELSVRRAS
jgi:transcriptional regulator with XRE-family HTH domain